MNLEVGMYIRTEKGNIGQIENITDYNVWTTIYLFPFNKETNSANDEKITKASYNIIDLIDLSDYVNNEKVTEICSSSNYKAVCINSFYKNSRKKIYLAEKDIKSILTKEQIENMSYVVKKS